MTPLTESEKKTLDSIKMDILEFIKQQYAVTKPLTATEEDQFNANSYVDNLLDFVQFSKRWIEPRPRAVEYSRSLMKAKKFRRILDEIQGLSLKGKPLWPYLSKKVAGHKKERAVTSPDRKKKRDKDLLLNAWGIHHFHLGRYSSRKKDPDGFVAQRNELLFVRVDSDVIYFIDVKKHDDFECLEILQTFIDNWPHTQPCWYSRLTQGLSLKVTSCFNPDETRELRGAGVLPLLYFDDGIPCLPPNGGMVSSCNSLEDVDKVSKIKEETIKLVKTISNKESELRSSLNNQGTTVTEADWGLRFLDGKFHLHEKNSGQGVKRENDLISPILPSLPVLNNLK